jgi:hypothetical protein
MRIIVILGVWCLAGVVPAQPQESAAGGLLVAYRARAGQRAELVAGYRRHLEWHRANADSLTWHAWDVLSGPGSGLLVDGTFGRPFAALDARVNPAGDERDAAANIYPYAESAFRELVRLRADLSTATPLETGTPTRLVQVVRFTSPHASVAQLRTALATLRNTRPARSMLPYTVYECVTCPGSGSFIMMVWRDGLASFDDAGRNPDRRLNQLLEARQVPGLQATSNEIWVYRADLHYRRQ